jgi:hypothetical protein
MPATVRFVLNLESFRALRPGPVTVDDEVWALTVHDLGVLRVPSGRLEANAPFENMGEAVVVDVPAGEHPVRVTVADVSGAQDGSHTREAYLSVVLAEGEPALLEAAPVAGKELAAGEFWVIPVGAGTVGFVDAEAARSGMPPVEVQYDDVFDNGSETSWFALMDSPAHLREGSANIVLPLAKEGENVVLAHSGWGDGVYPVLRTVDSAGSVLAVHIDLGVVGDV